MNAEIFTNLNASTLANLTYVACCYGELVETVY